MSTEREERLFRALQQPDLPSERAEHIRLEAHQLLRRSRGAAEAVLQPRPLRWWEPALAAAAALVYLGWGISQSAMLLNV